VEQDKLLLALNSYMKTGTIWESLDITITKVGLNEVAATMPIAPRSMQQSGFLHGGALLTLAESLATLGSALNIDSTRQMCFGLAVTANHFHSRKEGIVTGFGRPIYKGRTSMVWDVNIKDEDGIVITASRCTIEIVDRPAATLEQLEAQMKTMAGWDSFIDLPKFW
jgi:1,4-dihydroxy-2-naphthoyl-CoA hydrolase